MRRLQTKRIKHLFLKSFSAFILLTVCGCFWLLYLFNFFPQRAYSAADFSIATLQSPIDFNQNGQDDYADLLCGAKDDALRLPVYDGRYWEEGYPPEDVGVCTDVIWRAFRQAGYDLRGMVDRDIAARPEAYPWITTPDSAIDFRRVKNLNVFFARHAVSLTTDSTDATAWQPGDIAVFRNAAHIGIVSDLRGRGGRAYLIHNGGWPQLKREEDYFKRATASAHYRFDAALLDDAILVKWEDAPAASD